MNQLVLESGFSEAGIRTLGDGARKVLVVVPGVPHPREGGSTVVFYEYIKAVKNAGFNVLNLLLLQPDNASQERLSVYREALEELGRFEVLPCWSARFVTSRRARQRFDAAALESVRERLLDYGADAVLAL